MRKGKKNEIERELNDAIEALKRAQRELHTAPPDPISSIGSTWTNDGPRVLIGDWHALSVHDARELVSKLVSAIYCCERGGNTEDPKAEAKEHAFLDLLKKNLFHSLTRDRINTALP